VKSIDGGYALYLGQLEPWKGIRTLVRAWSDLKGITLKIAGDGSLKTELEKEIAESRTQNILFLGHLGRKSVWEVLSKSSFVVTPSEWYENYPYSVMETMMCGKPIVASNIGGLPEMIRDGETGLLFESGNIGALKGKLEILLKNVQLRKEMGEKGREMAVREFSPEIHYAKLMKIYEDAVSTKFRRGR
jgi:glycosyltransferase involved in cell wall biosynthesis